ncbi:MAG: hypothetical protein ACTH14_07415 [Jeotgalicoccus sp.]
MKNITIEFLNDTDGKQQVIDLVHEIAMKAKLDEDYTEMAKRIAQVFYYLKNAGVPPKHQRTIKAKSKDGFEITLSEIVKELIYHKPLLEVRVNWRPAGAFRAIFFYEQDANGNQSLYFTKAVIKDNNHSEAFESIVVESEIMMNDFYTKKE